MYGALLSHASPVRDPGPAGRRGFHTPLATVARRGGGSEDASLGWSAPLRRDASPSPAHGRVCGPRALAGRPASLCPPLAAACLEPDPEAPESAPSGTVAALACSRTGGISRLVRRPAPGPNAADAATLGRPASLPRSERDDATERRPRPRSLSSSHVPSLALSARLWPKRVNGVYHMNEYFARHVPRPHAG